MKTIDTILQDLYVVHGLDVYNYKLKIRNNDTETSLMGYDTLKRYRQANIINNLLISRIEFEPQHRTYILVGMSTCEASPPKLRLDALLSSGSAVSASS